MKNGNLKWWMLYACVMLIMAPAVAAQAPKAAVQQTADTAIEDAAARVGVAARAGAETWAKDLYDEASWRLNFARERLGQDKKQVRDEAMLRAVQAKYAAEAAEAKARWLSTRAEVMGLRTEIVNLGGKVPEAEYADEAATPIERGDLSASRIEAARMALERAKSAGAEAKYGDELGRASTLLGTAVKVASVSKQSDSADHLAYVTEMTARRAEYLTRLDAMSPLVPELRLERAKLAQAAIELKAAEERRQREESERRLVEMQKQLQVEQAKRQAERAQLDQLRRQIEEQERVAMSRLRSDRQARLDAEERLDILRAEYEVALASAKSVAGAEVERRKAEDQALLASSLRDREVQSEQVVQAGIDRISEQLERDRASGRFEAGALAARREDIARRLDELTRIRSERIESERRRQDLNATFSDRVAASERRLRESEAEAARVAAQIEAEQKRTAVAEAELKRLQEQMARQAEQERQRTESMKKELAELAQTRSDERGFIVTLPGLLFDTGKSDLKAGAKSNLSKIAAQLSGNDRLRITVEGHTDAVGSDETNQKLSETRAKAVADYLVSQGVDRDRITSLGKGEAAPIASNDTPAGRQQNRRVEIVIGEVSKEK